MTMTAMVAGGRPTSAGIAMVVTVLLAALVALCCCVGEFQAGQPETHSVTIVTDQIGPTQSPETDGAAHVEDCERSAMVAMAGPPHLRDVLSVPAARVDRQVDTLPIFSGVAAATPWPPASHLLCVMRT